MERHCKIRMSYSGSFIIEEGFPFSKVGHPPNTSAEAVLLSNSIGLADMSRLQVLCL